MKGDYMKDLCIVTVGEKRKSWDIDWRLVHSYSKNVYIGPLLKKLRNMLKNIIPKIG